MGALFGPLDDPDAIPWVWCWCALTSVLIVVGFILIYAYRRRHPRRPPPAD